MPSSASICIVYFLILLMGFSSRGFAAEIQPPFDVEGGGSYAEKKQEEKKNQTSEFGGVPALFNTPETGLALGGVLIYVPPYERRRVSSIIAGIVMSERHQMLAALFGEKYFAGDTWMTQLYASAQDYPDLFYGLGRDTRFADQEAYTWNQRTVAWSLRYIYQTDLRIGLNVAVSDDHFRDFVPGGLLDSGTRGAKGGRSLGVGGSIRWDTTNDEYSPSQGDVLNVMLVDYSKTLGSDYQFRNLEVNAKKYWSFAPQDIMAFQVYVNHNTGDTPFYQLARLGGKNLLRGYFLGRFRDQSMLIAQAEYRRHIGGNWGAVAFGGMGNVGKNVVDVVQAKPKPSFGVGARYKLVEKQKINVRLDLAFAPVEPNPSIYLYILEAF